MTKDFPHGFAQWHSQNEKARGEAAAAGRPMRSFLPSENDALASAEPKPSDEPKK